MAVKLKDGLAAVEGVGLVVLVELWARATATERTTRTKTAVILHFKVFFSLFPEFESHWAAVTIAITVLAQPPKISPIAAQNCLY